MFAHFFSHRLISTMLAMAFFLSPLTMYAATTTYTPRTQHEMIAYLQGVLVQLQAQLAAQQSGGNTVSVTRTSPNPFSIYAVSLAPYSIGRTSATFRGDANKGSSPTAEVWFEYGPGSKLTKRTDTKTLTKKRRQTITIPESGLIPETQYRYRMVIEDERGNRQYGQVMNFTTIHEAETQTFTGRPAVETEGAVAISNSSAELGGFVTMNDYEGGYVFLVYGTNRSVLNDLSDDYESYGEIPKLADTSKKMLKEKFSGRDKLVTRVTNLKAATRYYYRACVQFGKAGDGFKCGAVESFTTLN